MKHITKLSFLAAIVAVFGTNAAFADDQQLQNRLAAQRAQSSSSVVQTTVAVYAGQRDNGQSVDAIQGERSETRFELRSNAHGQQFGVFTAAH
jgi:hypothetical protein